METEKASINSGGVDENQCKICWENVIDCVLLDCGHMLTCTDCGKVLSECKYCFNPYSICFIQKQIDN